MECRSNFVVELSFVMLLVVLVLDLMLISECICFLSYKPQAFSSYSNLDFLQLDSDALN